MFQVTLTIASHLTALSNMPEQQVTSLPGGLKRVVFQPTAVKMSSYLLAFAVGEFDFVAGTTKNGVPVRCFAPAGRAERAAFALDTAIKTLDLYDDYFDFKYCLPKLDLIALPEFAGVGGPD